MSVLSEYLTHGLRMIDVLRIICKDGQLYLRGWVACFTNFDTYLYLQGLVWASLP